MSEAITFTALIVLIVGCIYLAIRFKNKSKSNDSTKHTTPYYPSKGYETDNEDIKHMEDSDSVER